MGESLEGLIIIAKSLLQSQINTQQKLQDRGLEGIKEGVMNEMKRIIIGVAGIRQHGREMWCEKKINLKVKNVSEFYQKGKEKLHTRKPKYVQ